jgi:cytosine/uracil/thiamine/allantoin permease
MSSKLYNEDLAPTGPEQRTWTTYNLAALWVGMAIVITTYTLDSGLMVAGISWWQALLTISLGNVIILIPMILNAHAGTKYGVLFPVFVRSSFGVKGANVAAMARALVRRQVHSYSNGYNWKAIGAVLVGVVPVVPGFLKAATPGGIVENPTFIDSFYTYGLFFTFGVAAVAYLLMSLLPGRSSVRQNPDVRA